MGEIWRDKPVRNVSTGFGGMHTTQVLLLYYIVEGSHLLRAGNIGVASCIALSNSRGQSRSCGPRGCGPRGCGIGLFWMGMCAGTKDSIN